MATRPHPWPEPSPRDLRYSRTVATLLYVLSVVLLGALAAWSAAPHWVA